MTADTSDSVPSRDPRAGSMEVSVSSGLQAPRSSCSLPYVNALLGCNRLDGSAVYRTRLLFIAPTFDHVLLFDVDDRDALPIIKHIEVFLDDLSRGRCNVLESDPLAVRGLESDWTPSALKYRDTAWTTIRDLVERDDGAAYYRSGRSKLIAEACATHHVTPKTVYKLLRRYWRRGQVTDTLLPDWNRCGAPGVDRPAGERKRGRPNADARKHGDRGGINVTPEIAAKLAQGFRRFALNAMVRRTLRDAYYETVRVYFVHSTEVRGGTCVPIVPPAWTIPTFQQFKYWGRKRMSKAEYVLGRRGQHRFDLVHRPITGSHRGRIWGPGALYQIDATVINLYAVSRINPLQVVGRPTLFVVIDVFSWAVVGFHVSFEAPSYREAALALEVACLSKASLCERYGYPFVPEEHPGEGLPEALANDRGQLHGPQFDHAIRALGIRNETLPAGRGDWKSPIEKQFDLQDVSAWQGIPGTVNKDRQRGDPDPQRSAAWDLDDIMRHMLVAFTQYNLTHEIPSLAKDGAIMRAGVSPTPADVWDWGMRNRTGRLRAADPDRVRVHLLPGNEAPIDGLGIHFQGLHYLPPDHVRDEYMVRGVRRKTPRVSIAHDPRNLGVLYLRSSDGQSFDRCPLHPGDSAFEGRTSTEYSLWRQSESERRVQEASRKLGAGVTVSHSKARITANALARQDGVRPSVHDKRDARTREISLCPGQRSLTESLSAVQPEYSDVDEDNVEGDNSAIGRDDYRPAPRLTAPIQQLLAVSEAPQLGNGGLDE